MAKKMAPKGNTTNTKHTTTSGTLKSPKGKKPSQGGTRETGEMSDHRVQNAPDSSLDRGIGSSFAMAVGQMMNAAAEMKGSQTNFLGEPSEVLDPKQFAHSLLKGK